MKKFIKPLFTLLITIIFIGCGEKKKSRGLIGATCMNIANPFFKVIEESMRDEAAKHGYDLIYLGCEMDISKQQKQIQDFLAKGVVAVAVNPKDSKAIGTAVKECNDANVPVFSFDVRRSHQVLCIMERCQKWPEATWRRPPCIPSTKQLR